MPETYYPIRFKSNVFKEFIFTKQNGLILFVLLTIFFLIKIPLIFPIKLIGGFTLLCSLLLATSINIEEESLLSILPRVLKFLNRPKNKKY